MPLRSSAGAVPFPELCQRDRPAVELVSKMPGVLLALTLCSKNLDELKLKTKKREI